MKQRFSVWFSSLFAVFLGFFLFLVVSEIGLRFLYPQWSEFNSGRFIKRELVSGYAELAIGKSNFKGFLAQNNGDFRISLELNNFGLRNREPVTDANGRIWIVGDSMAFGWGVEQPEMYSSIIAELSGIETYNVASPGTDICGYQSLIARMPNSVQPAGMILGLTLENDVRDYDCRREAAQAKLETSKANEESMDLSEIKEWLWRNSALYNAIAVSLKRVPVVIDFLKQVGLVKQEHAYKITFDESRISELTRSVVKEVSRTRSLIPPNTPFAILIIPARFEIRDSNPFYEKLRIGVAAAFAAEGIDVIDPFPRFKQAGFRPTHFLHDGHWSPLGHKIAGEDAVKWLKGVRYKR